MPSQRAYENSHPWLTFHLDLSKSLARLWHKLGEITAECESLTRVPLRPEAAKRLHEVYLAKGALATTAIEGNTLTEEDALRIVRQQQLNLPASQEYQKVEIANVIEAVNDICLSLLEADHALTPAVIADYNRRVLKGTLMDEGAVPGEVRQHSVGVGGYRGAPAQDCDYLLERLCAWLTKGAFHTEGADRRMAYAVIKACIAHVYLAWIHPFGDGNGRTARLVEFHILVEAGVPLAAAHLLSNHYNLTRARYYQELARASATRDVFPFLDYAATGMEEQLRQQLNVISKELWQVAWENFIHSRFHGKHGEAAERRKRLVLDLSDRSGPVRRSGISSMSARLARAYATKTDKTVTRDINALVTMDLVVRTPEGLVANRDLLLAFSRPAQRRNL